MIANGYFLSIQNEIHCIAPVPKQRLHMCFAFGEDLIGEEDGWHQERVQNESNTGVYASRVFSQQPERQPCKYTAGALN